MVGSRFAALGTLALAFALAGPATAQTPAPGADALGQARTAWEKGALESSEALYREALEKGGLSPSETLEGYVRLGSIRASFNKRESAVAAFKAASILDDKFSVPREAGTRGMALAERARRETARIGSIQLALQVPKEVQSGKSFKVTATLDKGHISIVNRLGLLAKDGTTGKEITLDARPETSVEFEVGSDITLPGASIVVHIDALDTHKNRLASAEERVRVPDDKPPAPVAAGVAKKEPANPLAPAKPVNADTGARKGGGFWSSPWPYVVGGLAVVGIGTAVYFGTRPAQIVTVGQVGVGDE